MPTTKKTTRARARSRSRRSASTRAAIEIGRRQGEAVIASRIAELKRGAKLTPEAVGAREGRSEPAIRDDIAALLDAQVSAGWLMAEGDSWFDYPGDDILRLLKKKYHYRVASVADAGDLVEDMAYSKKQSEKFTNRLEELLSDGHVPRAILLSGGGNDIAGDEFRQLINAKESKLPTINEDVVRGVIDVRLKDAYIAIISRISTITEGYLVRPIPIILHGYAHPVPDGRGVLGGWWRIPGPWLRPGFHHKGHGDQTENTAVMEKLIDRFNAMLKAVAATNGFSHVHYLNLRDTLRNDEHYKDHWANELHPTDRGFRLVTAEFARLIASLCRS
jgi:hypothetical protein